jgi:hypothetical protein
MPRYKMLFNTERSGILAFDADDSEHAQDIYEGLINGDTYIEDLDNAYEDIDESNTTYYELTDMAGRVVAS